MANKIEEVSKLTSKIDINEFKPQLVNLIKRMNIEKIELKQEVIETTLPGDVWASYKRGKRIITFIEEYKNG